MTEKSLLLQDQMNIKFPGKLAGIEGVVARQPTLTTMFVNILATNNIWLLGTFLLS